MADNHWDERYDGVRHEDQVPAPELPNDLMNLVNGISNAAMESQGPPSEEEIEKAVRREQERAERKADYEVDKWEAAQQGISVGELRQRRYEEEKNGTTEPQQFAQEAVEPEAEPDKDPIEEMVDLLKQIAQDVSDIKDQMNEEVEGDAHG